MPGLKVEVNSTVSATMRECGDERHGSAVGGRCLEETPKRRRNVEKKREKAIQKEHGVERILTLT